MVLDRRIKNTFPEILSGWKEIANYLGKGIRTVQRYERDLGLPVRRTTRSERAPIIATKSELDAWVNARPIAETFQLARPPIIIATSVKESAAEMHRLRDQMHELQAELRISLTRLHHTIDNLRQEMGHRDGMSKEARFQPYKSRSHSDALSDFSILDPSRRKTS